MRAVLYNRSRAARSKCEVYVRVYSVVFYYNVLVAV